MILVLKCFLFMINKIHYRINSGSAVLPPLQLIWEDAVGLTCVKSDMTVCLSLAVVADGRKADVIHLTTL